MLQEKRGQRAASAFVETWMAEVDVRLKADATTVKTALDLAMP